MKKPKREIQQYVLRSKRHYPFGRNTKGVLVKERLGKKTIDLDAWIKKKKKEGFKVRETDEGVTLKQDFNGHRQIFIAKDDIKLKQVVE